MAALQYADVPDYSALILRRTFRDLNQPDAIMTRSKEWLAGTGALWNDNNKRWTFPSGATLTFGYLEHEDDKLHFQGAAFQYCGFDELTQFGDSQYRYLLSRMRRLKSTPVPVRVRAASNPGGPGHAWVKQRFLAEGREAERMFVPAGLADNPYLDRDEYVQMLAELDPTTRRQLLDGDWDAKPQGTKFHREWFRIVEQAPAACRWVRYWDLAATEPTPGRDPDWTVGARLGVLDGRYWLADVQRARLSPQGVEALIAQTAQLDGVGVEVYMEQEPGSSGVAQIDQYRRNVLDGYTFRGVRSTGSKEVRANPFSSAAEAGNVALVRGPWIGAFLDEVESFPQPGFHDDQVDAISGAHQQLKVGRGGIVDWDDDEDAPVLPVPQATSNRRAIEKTDPEVLALLRLEEPAVAQPLADLGSAILDDVS